ncbi:unnamed protein product [Cercopithifilaria johnstoni]|uniref:Uncharacterized protein n=1 Tax=Cercopithifilaria johnstoni TaxID=2874296 RepID=A0A8J2MMW4_9BILA|nr:unnamed protein product [Cercopithifilaria johnstoni]
MEPSQRSALSRANNCTTQKRLQGYGNWDRAGKKGIYILIPTYKDGARKGELEEEEGRRETRVEGKGKSREVLSGARGALH